MDPPAPDNPPPPGVSRNVVYAQLSYAPTGNPICPASTGIGDECASGAAASFGVDASAFCVAAESPVGPPAGLLLQAGTAASKDAVWRSLSAVRDRNDWVMVRPLEHAVCHVWADESPRFPRLCVRQVVPAPIAPSDAW